MNHFQAKTRLWGNTDVIALFDAETDMNEIVSLLKQAHHLDENTAYKIEQIRIKTGNVNGWIIPPNAIWQTLMDLPKLA